METFYYKARDGKGELVQGEVIAINEDEVRKNLSEKHLTPVFVSSKPLNMSFKKMWEEVIDYFQKVSLDELLIFNRQLHIVYSTGFPLLNGLELVRLQTENTYFKKVLANIISQIEQGISLHKALSKYPRIFDNVYITLIQAGEESGKLDDLLEKLSELIEQRSENQEQLKSAMFYPKLVIFVVANVLLGVIYVIVPRIKTFFSRFDAELPAITQFLIDISDFFVAYWYGVALIIGAMVFGFLSARKNHTSRIWLHKLFLKAPIFGKLNLEIETSIMSLVMELLIRGGIPIIRVLEIVQGSLKNAALQDAVKKAKSETEKGRPLAKALEEHKIFPKLFTNVISIGEESGSMETVLSQISAYYRKQIKYRLIAVTKAIEPIMLFFIFGIVLVIALAVFLPVWKMSSLIGK